ncbi:OmpP1/FadL family transporter [Flavobacterium sp.]|uniref:OmpP1/FadL family transporter n=1 Tax=Flavobacterium sp. TaxID=239 RepID=UPI0035B48995
MKKIFIPLLLLGCTFLSNAQETTINDALRYSISNLNGTARYRGMSGAFGSVGGDLSAINVNPAGSIVFNNNFASFSTNFINLKNDASYFGNNTSENYSTLDFNQAGIVFVFKDYSGKSDVTKFAFALNYENANNFRNDGYAAGINPNNSIDKFFLDKAQGLPIEYVLLQPGETIDELYTYLGQTPGLGFPAQQAMMAYQAYLIEADSPNTYYSNVPAGDFYQDNYFTTRGYNGKLTTNFALSVKDRFHFGINLNAHFTDFVKTTSVYEANNNPIFSSGYTATDILFENEVYTFGSGFSLNLGAIAKVTNEFRVGLAYESPTWYHLNDELVQRLAVSTTDGTNDYREVIAPNVVNLYQSYKIQTPSIWTFSGSYIFGKKGLISIDYMRKDFCNTKFKPTNNSFYNELNQQMKTELKNAFELRVGGEFRIKEISFRGGYRFEESPYKSNYSIGDLNGFSAGMGYNFPASRLDLAYSHDQRTTNEAFVTSGMNDAARIQTKSNNVTLTYSINF